MDLIILFTIIATVIAVVTAGAGIYLAFRGIGYFQYLGGKKPGCVPPAGKTP